MTGGWNKNRNVVLAALPGWMWLCLVGCSDGRQSAAPARPKIEFPVVDKEGLTARIAAHQGSVVVVDFWGTWCPVCIMQFPHTVSVVKARADKGVKLLTVALDGEETLPMAGDFMGQQEMVPETFAAPFGRSGKSCREYGIPDCRVPYYRVYGRDGTLFGAVGGLEYDEHRLANMIDRAARGEAPTPDDLEEPVSEPETPIPAKAPDKAEPAPAPAPVESGTS